MVAAEAVADGIDIFGGSLEELVSHDAVGFVETDAGVFKAVIGVWYRACGEHNTVDADGFVRRAGFEDDTL